jgi:predicted transcriptional regulator
MSATATTSATRPVAVKLDQGIRDRIQILAVARHRSAHWLMREAVQQYVDREEKHEAFRQDGIRAWNDYQATGLHVTQDEADDWLGKLEAGQDVEPPECHA